MIITTDDGRAYERLAQQDEEAREAYDRAERKREDDESYAAECEAEAIAEQQADEALERQYEERGGNEPPEDYSMDPQLNGQGA